MAKETVKVDNGLEEIKLETNEKIKTKKDKKEKQAKEKKNKKEAKKNRNKTSYFAKVRAEMKLVTWPTKKNVVRYSLATIMMVILLAAFFIGISALFDLLYGYVQGWIG